MLRPLSLTLLFAVTAFGQETPPPVRDEVTVTATRTETRVADTPSSVVVLSQETIATSAAATLDDVLRQVPGFTLFRRSGSRVANPTSQGVTLRGIGASGASRAVVLDDGIPLNDPFGGWVYWGRVPRVAVARVEVLRGGASDLYGSGAMGGVVQFIRRHEPALSVETSAGSQQTGTASLFAGATRGDWNGSIAADLFTTAGWTLVRPTQRGAVDVHADSAHAAVDATVRRNRAFVRASYYSEDRNNGTPLQVNDTAIRQLAAGASFGALTLRAFASDQDYRQTFSAVAGDRNSERLTIDQSVPSTGAGISGQWAHPIGARHALLAGGELRGVRGESDELRFAANGSISRVVAGGEQRTASLFVEDVFAITPSLSVTGGLRYDSWKNDGVSEQRKSEWSPRLSALYRHSDALSFTASGYRAFRAPTLNELYRDFRVGNIQTLANGELGPERLTALESGVRFRWLRATAFWMSMTDTVANVTLSTTPALITRQRRNIGSSRSIGAEVEGEWRVGNHLRASAGWLFVHATAGDRRVPQVPRHQLTSQLVYTSRITAAVQARWSTMQFDDDLNELPLRGYVVEDVFTSVPLWRGIEATVAIENVFDREVDVSATPVITTGQPRSIRVGLRYAR